MYQYTRQDEELAHMPSKVQTAFLKLQKMGVPVKIWYNVDPNYGEYRGYFWIDCEEEDGELFYDYWEMYKNEKCEDILNSAGVYSEWYNPAYLCVYDI
jgi:hypothetical protein